MTKNCDTEFVCDCGMATISGSIDLEGKTYVPADDPHNVRGAGELRLDVTEDHDSVEGLDCCCAWTGSTYFYATKSEGGVDYDDRTSVGLEFQMCSQAVVCATVSTGAGDYSYVGTTGGGYSQRRYCPGEPYHESEDGSPSRSPGFPSCSFTVSCRENPCNTLSVSVGGDAACMSMCVKTCYYEKRGEDIYIPHYTTCYENDLSKECVTAEVQDWPWDKQGEELTDPIDYFDKSRTIPKYKKTWYSSFGPLYESGDVDGYCEIDAVDALQGAIDSHGQFYRPQDWWVVAEQSDGGDWSTTSPESPPSGDDSIWCFTWCGTRWYRVAKDFKPPRMELRPPCGAAESLLICEVDEDGNSTTCLDLPIQGDAGGSFYEQASFLHAGARRKRFLMDYNLATCTDPAIPEDHYPAHCDNGVVSCDGSDTLDCADAHCVDLHGVDTAVCGDGWIACSEGKPLTEEYEDLPFLLSTSVPDVPYEDPSTCVRDKYCMEKDYYCKNGMIAVTFSWAKGADAATCKKQGRFAHISEAPWYNGETRRLCAREHWSEKHDGHCVKDKYIQTSSHSSEWQYRSVGAEYFRFGFVGASEKSGFSFYARPAAGVYVIFGDGHGNSSGNMRTSMGFSGKAAWSAGGQRKYAHEMWGGFFGHGSCVPGVASTVFHTTTVHCVGGSSNAPCAGNFNKLAFNSRSDVPRGAQGPSGALTGIDSDGDTVTMSWSCLLTDPDDQIEWTINGGC